MAPFAALLAGRLPHQPFGALIGGMVIITNGRAVMLSFDVPGPIRLTVMLFVLAATIVAAVNAWRREHVRGVERSFFEEADQDRDTREA